MANFKITINKTDNSFCAKRKGNPKFFADAFIHENEEYFLLMNGVNLVFTSTDKTENYFKEHIVLVKRN